MPHTQTISTKLRAYAALTRFDKPVGIELLLWPTLWGLFLAQYGETKGLPSWQLVLIFTLGAVFMRAAGCAINDYADRNFDGQVERTKHRPLAAGIISPKEALLVFAILVLTSASLLLFLPIEVFYWSFGALALASIYPFMKRWIYLPQFVLGAAFSWAIPMAYVAVNPESTPPLWCWLLYAANLAWTVAYDTEYAMTDRADDLKAGIKSTAILFGTYDVLIIHLLQGVFLLLLGACLQHYFGWMGLSGLVLPCLLFGFQHKLIKNREPTACFKAFLHNVWVGRVIFMVILCYILLKPTP